MSAITQLLDNLADGSQTLAEVAADFEEFDWETPSVTPDDAEEDSPPIEDSFDEVQVDSRLTARQYARLAEAYRTAITEVNPDEIFTAASSHWKNQPRVSDGENAGQWTESPGASGVSKLKKVVSAVIYKKHSDGAVVAQRGDRRLRWDAGTKKYAAEERENGDWTEKEKLTKAAAYVEMKSGDWREPDVDASSAMSLEIKSPTTETLTTETPTPTSQLTNDYVGPRFEMPQSVDQKDFTEFIDALRKKIRAEQLGVEKLSSEELLEVSALQDTFNSEHVGTRLRITQEAQIAGALDVWMQQNGITEEPTEAFKQKLADQVHEAFAGKKIAVRVTPKNLENILIDGRFKTQFESGKSKGSNDTELRAKVEAAWFGIGAEKNLVQMISHEPEKRPIYGYVAVDGIRPAGVGTGDIFGVSTDALSQYGQIQVILRDNVRDRTTAMFGDSVNNRHQGLPSPVNQPSWMSFTPAWKSMLTRGLTGEKRDVNSTDFRHGNYAEAQIHGGVTLSDIDEVIFPTTPTTALREKLADAGVSWRVLNFKTAADSSLTERATALRIADQDVSALTSEIAEQLERRFSYVAKGDKYTTEQIDGDVKKMRAQLKKLQDALPILRGEKKDKK